MAFKNPNFMLYNVTGLYNKLTYTMLKETVYYGILEYGTRVLYIFLEKWHFGVFYYIFFRKKIEKMSVTTSGGETADEQNRRGAKSP